MADIFISYARADRARVAPLVAALQAAGWSVWWDPAITPGQEFDDLITVELERARAVVVVWTPVSVASRWVRGEARVGADRGVLVPVRFENAQLPIDVRAIHTTDLDGWGGNVSGPAFQMLCQSLAALLGGVTAERPPASVPPPKAATGKPSLAVLPFANLSGDPEQDYFADGMMEEIVTALSRVRSIFVIASGSTRGFKGKTVSPQEVGRQLGVSYVLEGSVRKAGRQVRIAVKLMDAGDGAQIWAERYEGALEDVFALQDRVALNVVGVIEPTVQNAEIRRALARPARDPDTYDLYLRAAALMLTYEKEEVIEALRVLERALAIDPKYAAAMGLAAYAHAQIVVSGWAEDTAPHRAAALDLARRAVQLAGDDADVLAMAGGTYLPLNENFEGAIALADRAITLNPGSSMAWLMSGYMRAAAGDTERAIEHIETSMRLDPASTDRGFQLSGIAIARFDQGRFAEAAALLTEALHLQPSVSMNQALLAACYGHLGEKDLARRALADYTRLSQMPIAERGASLFRKREHYELFRDGIARARSFG